MPYCEKCGAEREPTDRFCGGCGEAAPEDLERGVDATGDEPTGSREEVLSVAIRAFVDGRISAEALAAIEQTIRASDEVARVVARDDDDEADDDNDLDDDEADDDNDLDDDEADDDNDLDDDEADDDNDLDDDEADDDNDASNGAKWVAPIAVFALVVALVAAGFVLGRNPDSGGSSSSGGSESSSQQSPSAPEGPSDCDLLRQMRDEVLQDPYSAAWVIPNAAALMRPGTISRANLESIIPYAFRWFEAPAYIKGYLDSFC